MDSDIIKDNKGCSFESKCEGPEDIDQNSILLPVASDL